MRPADVRRWCRHAVLACSPWLLALLLCPIPARAEDQTLILQRLRQQLQALEAEQAGHKALAEAMARDFIPIPGRKYRMSKYTVTFAQWDACVAAGACNGFRPDDAGWGREQRPVINVSWDDTQAFIAWLNAQTGKRYRLPTEDEWEHAARGGTATAYYWGNEIGVNHANCDGCATQWRNPQTVPVGSFAANPFGLFDMLGNVWQWTSDCWEGDCGRRVLRGGAWFEDPEHLRVTTRDWTATSGRGRIIGFRLVEER